MAVFTSSGASFSLRPLFKLYIQATTTAVTGGTQVDIYAYAQRTGTETRTPSSSIAKKSFNMTNARATNTSGSFSEVVSNQTWTYNWANGDPQDVWIYTRFYAYSAGTSTSMTLTAADGAGGLIGTATASLTFDLFAQPVILAEPTNLSVSTGASDFSINWSAVSGVSTYGIWWNSGSTGPSTGAAPDFSGITGTSYVDGGKTPGTTRYYWVSSRTVGTPSAWVFAGSGTIPSTVTLTYNYNGNGSGNTTATVTQGATFTLTSAPTRSGYTFSGWNDANGTSYGTSGTSSQNAPTTDFTLFAQWTLIAVIPSFTDSAVSTPATLGVAYSDGVVATNASSYSVLSGAIPTGLSLNTSTGAITGTPTAQGTFSLVIRATSSTSNTADTSTLTIVVGPAGKRMTGAATSTTLTIAKRYTGSAWVDLTIMKRFDGTSWVDIQ